MRPASVGFQCPECVREGRATVRGPRRGTRVRVFAARWGPVTTTLAALNVAVYLLTLVLALPNGGGIMSNFDSSFFRGLSLVPACTTGEFPVLNACPGGDIQLWRLLTSAFLHYGLIHLAVNVLSLLFLGTDLERSLGKARFAAVYLVAALCGGAAVAMFSAPVSQTVGASGAVFGLLGAAVVFIRSRGGDLRPLISLLVINAVISLLPGISLLGHLGGLLGGALAALVLLATRRRVPLQWVGLGLLAVLPVVATAVVGNV
ncbi:MAG: rhomboid family intramembrane serine protease [Geodermatophilaceae bacterium]|nr:rhomboid family intramembrane serine protease [Geodermatophilaceae bacterium]